MADVPFTTYAFPATDAPTSRTLPDRLIDIINVKDFGATGNGVSDDWAAIMEAYNHTANLNRGTVFFPPGTYLVSQPIDFSPALESVGFLGVLGASTVTGNFADYVFKRDNDSGYSGFHAIEKLTVINIHATGGGIQLGGCVGGAIRDCDVTANKAINTGNANDLASLEITIENCTLSPGSNPSGSLGLMLFADGPAINCYVSGFAKGAICWGNQAGQCFFGCRFENCTIGFQPGANPSGGSGGAGGFFVEACRFKNCGTAILLSHAGGILSGVLIEGTNGQAPGGTNPQYGIYVPQGRGGACNYSGVIVNGQFDQYGIFIGGNESSAVKSNMFGVVSINSGSGSPWGSGATPVPNMSNVPFTKLVGCNVAPVTLTNRVIFTSPITSVTCPSNTVSLTVAFGNLNPLSGQTFDITVSGVPVSGYNGSFQGTVTGTNTLTYTVVGPLADSSGGEIVMNDKNLNEGDSFNISDSDSSSWAGAITGNGSTHAKARWSGSDLTVVGK